MLSLQHCEISHTAPSIATALRSSHGSQTHQAVPRDVFITPEASGVSSGSPSSAVPASPPAARGSSHPQRSLLRSWGCRKVGGGLGAPFGIQNINLNFPDSLEQLGMSTGTESRSHRKRRKLLRAGMFSDPLQFVHQSIPSLSESESSAGATVQDTALRAAHTEQVFRRYWGKQGCASAAELTAA